MGFIAQKTPHQGYEVKQMKGARGKKEGDASRTRSEADILRKGMTSQRDVTPIGLAQGGEGVSARPV